MRMTTANGTTVWCWSGTRPARSSTRMRTTPTSMSTRRGVVGRADWSVIPQMSSTRRSNLTGTIRAAVEDVQTCVRSAPSCSETKRRSEGWRQNCERHEIACCKGSSSGAPAGAGKAVINRQLLSTAGGRASWTILLRLRATPMSFPIGTVNRGRITEDLPPCSDDLTFELGLADGARANRAPAEVAGVRTRQAPVKVAGRQRMTRQSVVIPNCYL